MELDELVDELCRVFIGERGVERERERDLAFQARRLDLASRRLHVSREL